MNNFGEIPITSVVDMFSCLEIARSSIRWSPPGTLGHPISARLILQLLQTRVTLAIHHSFRVFERLEFYEKLGLRKKNDVIVENLYSLAATNFFDLFFSTSSL